MRTPNWMKKLLAVPAMLWLIVTGKFSFSHKPAPRDDANAGP